MALELTVCVRCVFTQFQTIINTARFEFNALVVSQGVCLAASGAHWIKELCHTPGSLGPGDSAVSRGPGAPAPGTGACQHMTGCGVQVLGELVSPLPPCPAGAPSAWEGAEGETLG